MVSDTKSQMKGKLRKEIKEKRLDCYSPNRYLINGNILGCTSKEFINSIL